MTIDTQPATHPTHDALLAAILDRPDDDLARLVYADWLEEHGDGAARERAEFIRCQVLGMPGSSDFDLLDLHLEAWCPWFERHDQLGFRRCQDRGGAIEVRHLGGQTTYWRRGFIEWVECSLAAWVGGECRRCGGEGLASPYTEAACPHCHGTGHTLAAGPDLVARHPVREVRAMDRQPIRVGSLSFPTGDPGSWNGRYAWSIPFGIETLDESPHRLPPDLFGLLIGHCYASDFFRYYPDEPAARAALSCGPDPVRQPASGTSETAMNPPFRVGDVVRLVSGGRTMTVTRVAGCGAVVCDHFDGGHHVRRPYRPGLLVLAERPYHLDPGPTEPIA